MCIPVPVAVVELEEDRAPFVFVLALELVEGGWKADREPEEELYLGVCRLERGEGVWE